MVLLLQVREGHQCVLEISCTASVHAPRLDFEALRDELHLFFCVVHSIFSLQSIKKTCQLVSAALRKENPQEEDSPMPSFVLLASQRPQLHC